MSGINLQLWRDIHDGLTILLIQRALHHRYDIRSARVLRHVTMTLFYKKNLTIIKNFSIFFNIKLFLAKNYEFLHLVYYRYSDLDRSTKMDIAPFRGANLNVPGLFSG
jgi:hypothetical protein